MNTELRQLSDREREILQLVATGLSNQQIANRLGVSVNTIKVHLRNTFGKIGATSRTEATMYALRAGIVTFERDLLAQSTEASNVLLEEPVAKPDAFVDTYEPWQPNPPHPEVVPAHVVDEPLDDKPDTEVRTDPVARVSVEPVVSIPVWRRRPVRIMILILITLVVGILLISIWVRARSVGNVVLSATPESPTTSTTSGAKPSRWQRLGILPNARAAFAIANLGDLVYMIGGEGESGVLDTMVRFDTRFGTWTALSKKPSPATDIQAVVIGGSLYVPGGRRSANMADISDAFERYDPRTEVWETLPSLPQPRSAYALATVEGKLYLIGGWDGTSFRSEVFEYDPDARSWSEQAPMPTARRFASASVVGDSIYVLGGENASGPLTTNEVYMPSQDERQAWGHRAPLPQPRSHFGTAAAASRIHVIGGEPDNLPFLVYTVRTDSWETIEASPEPVGSQPGILLLDTSILCLGGRVDAGGFATSMLSYQAIFTNYLPNTTN